MTLIYDDSILKNQQEINTSKSVLSIQKKDVNLTKQRNVQHFLFIFFRIINLGMVLFLAYLLSKRLSRKALRKKIHEENINKMINYSEFIYKIQKYNKIKQAKTPIILSLK